MNTLAVASGSYKIKRSVANFGNSMQDTWSQHDQADWAPDLQDVQASMAKGWNNMRQAVTTAATTAHASASATYENYKQTGSAPTTSSRQPYVDHYHRDRQAPTPVADTSSQAPASSLWSRMREGVQQSWQSKLSGSVGV